MKTKQVMSHTHMAHTQTVWTKLEGMVGKLWAESIFLLTGFNTNYCLGQEQGEEQGELLEKS